MAATGLSSGMKRPATDSAVSTETSTIRRRPVRLRSKPVANRISAHSTISSAMRA